MGRIESRLEHPESYGIGGAGTSGEVAVFSSSSTLTSSSSLTISAGVVSIGASAGVLTHVLNGLLSATFPTAGSESLYSFAHSDNTNGASDCTLSVRVGGGSGGDPAIEFLILGVQGWTIGIDNSASDALVIAASQSLGSSNAISISTAGVVSLSASSGANLIWTTDGAGDIGSGTKRPNNAFIKNSLVVAGTTTMDVTSIALNEIALTRNGATDFRFYFPGSNETLGLFPSGGRVLIPRGTFTSTAITGSSLGFFSAPGGTGLCQASTFNGNGVNTLALSGDSGTVGLYLTALVTFVSLPLVVTITPGALTGTVLVGNAASVTAATALNGGGTVAGSIINIAAAQASTGTAANLIIQGGGSSGQGANIYMQDGNSDANYRGVLIQKAGNLFTFNNYNEATAAIQSTFMSFYLGASRGSCLMGSAAIATNATDGFLYLVSCAGTPTGVPTGFTGRVPIVIDTSTGTGKLWARIGGSWVGILLA